MNFTVIRLMGTNVMSKQWRNGDTWAPTSFICGGDILVVRLFNAKDLSL